MPRTRYSAAMYLILVFASGILVGVVSHRLYITTTVNATAPQAPRSMAEFRRKYLAEMRARVGVNDEQIASVNKILDDTKARFDDLHKKETARHDTISREQVDSISALLTPPQKLAYDKWRDERARLHAAAQKQKDQQKLQK
jgi:hypothetical protein